VNPGLSRRFKIEDAFNFEDFDDADLLKILSLKLKNQDLRATDQAKKVAIEMLSRGRNRPNFGNAGEVENLISEAKARSVQRRQQIPASERPLDVIFEPQDFDPNHKRSENAATNLAKLFEDVVGCGDIIERLGGYQQIAAICKARDMDPREQIPTNFVFTGPPGQKSRSQMSDCTHCFLRYWQDDRRKKNWTGVLRHGYPWVCRGR
jgi:ribosomal protein L17